MIVLHHCLSDQQLYSFAFWKDPYEKPFKHDIEAVGQGYPVGMATH